jgi:hypothetical protein
MTAVHAVYLKCELKLRVCTGRFPETESRPAETTVKRVREMAAAAGWEVKSGNHGRDVCPPCRIQEIQTKAGQLALELPKDAPA